MEIFYKINKVLQDAEVRILQDTGIRVELYYKTDIKHVSVNNVPYDAIKEAIEEEFCVDDLNTKNRGIDYVKARTFYMYWLRNNTSLTSVQIGNKFNKDHATVLYCVRKLGFEFELYPALKLRYEMLVQRINKLIVE